MGSDRGKSGRPKTRSIVLSEDKEKAKVYGGYIGVEEIWPKGVRWGGVGRVARIGRDAERGSGI